MNKYDDTDYQIEREESIEYEEGSDTNVGSIEKDIKRCEQLTKPEHANWIGISNQLAIAHVVEKIKELEQENRIQRRQLNSAFDRGWIPKEKVKDKIEEKYKQREKAEKDNKIGTGIVLTGEIKALEELLEDK